MKRSFHATKFNTEFMSTEVPIDRRIEELRFWCSEFHRLRLAPLHKYGACGNLSFRISDGETPFIVTASGASFEGPIPAENFVRVLYCDLGENVVRAEGARRPSSESLFHFAIYEKRKDVNAVFHGHSTDVLMRAAELNLVETEREEPYGSVALVQSILDVLGDECFVVIKNHGFISLGRTMKEAGERALHIRRKSI